MHQQLAFNDVLGEEEHASAQVAVFARGCILGLDQAFFHNCFTQETGRHLQDDANAIAGFAGGVFARAVFEFLYNAQGILHGLVALDALDLHNAANAARIVLKSGAIQGLLVHRLLLYTKWYIFSVCLAICAYVYALFRSCYKAKRRKHGLY